jgi:cbb3-type cytochrome oxidase subunit 3
MSTWEMIRAFLVGAAVTAICIFIIAIIISLAK